MFTTPTPQKKSEAEIKSRILIYAELHIDVNWHQQPYKRDFFLIFREAYANGICGRRYKTKSKHQINGDSIGELLKQNFHPKKTRKKDVDDLISDLKSWWDEWSYAWDSAMDPIKRIYVRKPLQKDQPKE